MIGIHLFTFIKELKVSKSEICEIKEMLGSVVLTLNAQEIQDFPERPEISANLKLNSTSTTVFLAKIKKDNQTLIIAAENFRQIFVVSEWPQRFTFVFTAEMCK